MFNVKTKYDGHITFSSQLIIGAYVQTQGAILSFKDSVVIANCVIKQINRKNLIKLE